MGPDLQIKAWVSHCACVVEGDLATQHWSGKSEGYAWHSQHVEHAIARKVCSLLMHHYPPTDPTLFMWFSLHKLATCWLLAVYIWITSQLANNNYEGSYMLIHM